MMKLKGTILFCVLTFLLGVASKADAFVLINEILADPPSGISGDANGDGTTSSTQDEFVELLNLGDSTVDLSGWYLDDAVKTRHIFEVGTIVFPYEYLVVFSGGSLTLAGVKTQTASTGNLGLNNSGDTVSLYNFKRELLDQVVYEGEGGKDQSLTRYPEGTGDFVLHSSVEEAKRAIYSPGTTVSGDLKYEMSPVASVPELPGIFLFGLAWIGRILRKRFI